MKLDVLFGIESRESGPLPVATVWNNRVHRVTGRTVARVGRALDKAKCVQAYLATTEACSVPGADPARGGHRFANLSGRGEGGGPA